MAEVSSTHPRKRSSIGRTLVFVAGGLLVLLVILYFVATSSGFLKAMVLPRVGAAIKAQVTADGISLHPFSSVSLKNLRVQTTGAEPLVTAESAQVHYDLRAILRGNIHVQSLSLDSPAIQIVQEPDGKSNLDPLLQGDKKAKAKSEKAAQLDIRNVELKNGTVKMIKKIKDGSVQTTELTQLNVTLDRLANGQPGKLAVTSGIGLATKVPPSIRGTNDSLTGKMAGTFDFALDPQLLPQTTKGNLRFDVAQVEGAYRELAGLAAILQADLTPSEIRQLALQFERSGQKLGQAFVNGPLDLAKSEGHLNVAIQSIDRKVLNLVGATHGLDFAGTTLNSTNIIDITKQGSVISATGSVAGNKVSLIKNKEATPAIELAVDYQTSVNLTDKNAVLQKLSITGHQNQSELLRATLDRPMSLSWGGATTGVPDSTLQIAVNQFDLKAWQTVLGTNLPSGQLNAQLNIRSEQSGKLLTTKLNASIQNLTMQLGTNAIEQAHARFDMTGQIEDLKRIKFDQYQFELQQRNQPIAKGSGSGRLDLSNQELNFQTAAEASVPTLLKQFPLPEARVTNGLVEVKATVMQQGGKRTAAGNVQLKQFTGRYADYALQDFQTSVDFQTEMAQDVVQIQQAKIAFQQGASAGGTVDLTGRYHLTNQAGQITFKLVDLNQNALRPFLAPSLGEMKLISATLNGSGLANYDPKAESQIKADVNLSNWVATDPKIELPKTPITAQLHVDGSLRQQNVDLRKLSVALRQGTANAGDIDLSAKYNLTNHAAQVAFKVAALDQTALRPALGSVLGANKLVSAAVNADGSAGYDPNGDSSIKANLSVANLVVQDPNQTLPKTPLSAQLQVDGAVKKQVLDLRQFLVSLAPTSRAKNQLQLQGRVDLNQTNATASQLTLKAESLDLTPYYDLFAVTGKTNAATANTKGTPAPVSAETPKSTVGEPAPMSLPFQQFAGDVKIDRFYLREIAITNLQTTARIERGVVTLKPVQMALNGTPVTASLTANVAVPGYQYELALDTDKLPVAPLINSFSSGSTNRLQGDLFAHAQIKGAGTTGASLQKSLSGQASLSLTNMNLEIVGPKIRRLLDPIALVLRVPELTQTPINWVAAKTTMGQGKIDVNQFSVLSQAFYAEGQGAVQISQVLTNSPVNIPINLALRRSLAEKARLVSPDAPTNTAYVPLPTFVTLAGTLGDPKADINKLAITGQLLQTASQIPKVGKDASGILQGIGGILTGQKPSLVNTNVANQTNSVATNKAPAINPLDLLKILPKKK